MTTSISSKLFRFVLRSTGIVKRNFTGGQAFQNSLKRIRSKPLPEPTTKWRVQLAIKQSEFSGRPVWKIAPKDKALKAHVLYWHGGGYVYPATSSHFSFLCHMAQKYDWSVTAPLYPLAPESNASEIRQWAMDFYAEYAVRLGEQPFFMGGDSAGGGLTAASAMAARDAGLPMPSGLILICPWLDVVPDHPDQVAIEPRDAILTLSGLRETGETYAATLALDDPWVSPLHGSWKGLPKILCFGGGDDILVTNSRELKARSPDISYTELAGMIHIWPLLFFPESRSAQGLMAEFAKP